MKTRTTSLTLYENKKTGTTIRVSHHAAKMMGEKRTGWLVPALHKLMHDLEAKQAYVSKRGAAVDVHIISGEGWKSHIKLKGK